jgi:hypothetical protein
MQNLIKRFFTFANQLYTIFAAKSNMKDGRKSPQISPSVIFISLILLVLFKKRSLLSLDQFMRIDAAKRFIGRNTHVAVSDSTISRSLSTYSLPPLRSYLKSIYIRASHNGKCNIDVYGRKLKVACVDGSLFGKFYGCVLLSVGEANLMLDIEPTTGKGKESPTTRRLLDRAFNDYGDGFVDMILLDGLHANKKTINHIISHKSEVLIRTEEKKLSIIQDAEGLFRYSKEFNVQYSEGLDMDRLCEYQIWSSGGFEFPGVERSMKVAHVKERYIKDNKREDFWVLSSDEGLSDFQMRELAHIRWHIENNGFKQLNEQTNCDHVYTHDVCSFCSLMLMLFIGWDLFVLFDLEGIKNEYKYVKWTLGFLSELLLMNFYLEYHVIS